MIDSQVTFADNVKKLAGNCFYQLQQLRVIRRTLSTDAAKTLVHALISCRVDYCNSILYGACAAHLHPLQSVLNGAARLIVGKRKYDHITDTMCHDLHWLPVRQCIQYKLGIMVFKCLHRMAPSYLADTCTPVSSTTGRQHLRSAACHDLTIPRSRLVRYGSCCFAASGPSIWNSLPLSVRDLTLTFTGFCSRLKTKLYKQAYDGHTAPCDRSL